MHFDVISPIRSSTIEHVVLGQWVVEFDHPMHSSILLQPLDTVAPFAWSTVRKQFEHVMTVFLLGQVHGDSTIQHQALLPRDASIVMERAGKAKCCIGSPPLMMPGLNPIL